MKAITYQAPEGVSFGDYQTPEPEPGELLLKVVAASICGTDLRIFHGAHRMYADGTRRIPGHEMVGTVVEVGMNVKDYKVGERVFVAPNWGCGHCRQCIRGHNNLCPDYGAIGITHDGAFAEYMRVPAPALLQGNVIPIDGSLDPAQAALIEPFACVLRGQDALSIQPGETVLVMGAGPIGLMHLKLARLRGAGMVLVSEPVPERRAHAVAMGASAVVDPLEMDLQDFVSSRTGGIGADLIIVAAPSHVAQEAALGLAAKGGRVNFFGGLPKDRPLVQLDANLIHYKELVITGTTGCSTADCRRAAEIVSAGLVDLGDLISLRLSLMQVDVAIKAAEDRRALKVVFDFNMNKETS